MIEKYCFSTLKLPTGYGSEPASPNVLAVRAIEGNAYLFKPNTLVILVLLPRSGSEIKFVEAASAAAMQKTF